MKKSTSVSIPSGTVVFFSPLFLSSVSDDCDLVSNALAAEQAVVDLMNLGVMGVVNVCDDWGHAWLECSVVDSPKETTVSLPGEMTFQMPLAVGGGKIVFRDLNDLYIWKSDFRDDVSFEVSDGFYLIEFKVKREHSEIKGSGVHRLDITIYFECQPTPELIEMNITSIPNFQPVGVQPME